MKTVRVFLFIFLSIFLFSCSNAATNDKNLSIKDRAGNDIVLPEKIENIACLSPAVTDVILALGLADKIIAFDSTSKEILQTNNINVSNIAVFDMLNPDSEKMISIKPDIVLSYTIKPNMYGGFACRINRDNRLPANIGVSCRQGRSIKASDICIVVIPNSDTIKSIEDDITFLGNVLNKSSEASNIINVMDKNIPVIVWTGKEAIVWPLFYCESIRNNRCIGSDTGRFLYQT